MKFKRSFKKNADKMLALLMVVVLTVTGITVYSSAHTSTGGFPAAETGKYATVSFSNEIAVGSSYSADLKSLFGCQSVQNITLTSTVNGKNVKSVAFCIAPGTAIIPNSTYVSSEISSSRVKPYFKAAINYYYNTASISDDARRMVTQLFVWQIHTRNKEVGKDEKLTKVKLTESAHETLVKKILKEKYGLSAGNAQSAYDEAKDFIFVNGEANEYKNDIGAVKWDTTNSSGQTLLTGEDIPQDVKVKISVSKTIKKKDGTILTNGCKTGCVFRVYTDRECTKRAKDKDGNKVSITIPYTGTGVSTYMKFKYNDLPDYLYVKEYSAPAGSTVTATIYSIDLTALKDGDVKTIKVDASNPGWPARARVHKTDQDTGNALPDATFKLQEWNVATQTYVDLPGTFTSGADGYTPWSSEYYYTASNLGRFRFVETEYPANYKRTPCYKEFTITGPNQSITIEATNKIDDIGVLTVHKEDGTTWDYLPGAEFEVFHMDQATGKWISHGMMQEDPEQPGLFTMTNLPLNLKYKVKETKVPDYYWTIGVAPTRGVQVELTSDTESHDISVTNEAIRGQIVVKKNDSENGKPLPNGTFEVWETDETGKIPDHETTEDSEENSTETSETSETEEIEITDDTTEENTATLIGVYTTDENGQFVIPNVWQGSYIVIREISSPEGYKLDSENSTYFVDDLMTVSARYSGNNTDFTKTITITNDPIKVPVEVYKTSSSSKRDTLIPLADATFSIYDASQIPEENWMNFDTSLYTPVATMTTDANGKAVSEPLHIGKYVMVETGVPKNMLQCENHVFDIDERTGEVYYHEAVDPEFEANVKIIKKDNQTGNTIKLANTAFKIRNTSTGEFITQTMMVPSKENPDIAESTYETDTFYTDENGEAKLPEKLPVGSYECVEVVSPLGYCLDKTGVKFSVGTDEPYEWDPDTHNPLIVVEYFDDQVTGKLVLQKKGETLKALVDGKFIYDEMPLKDAEFTLKVAEDIYAPDNSGTLVYKAGTVIGTKTANEDGEIVFDNLPLGKYVYQETKCPDGYVIDENEYPVDILYKDQETHKVVVTQKVNNTRQKVRIRVVKKDKETEVTLPDAIFGIFASEDILNIDGNVVIKAGDLIEQQTTNEDGVAVFGEEMDYPVTNLVLKEIAPPPGYSTNKDEVLIEGLVAPQTSPVIEKEYVVYDEITKVSVSKVDITSKEEIEGATLTVWYIDESGNVQVVDEWISQLEPHLIQGLEVGKEYTLTEKIVAPGYVTAEDVKFTVIDESGTIQTVVMEDAPTIVEITKSDITTGVPVIGATLAIYDMEGNMITSWITTAEPHRIEKLPIGTYILREELPPANDGYVSSADITFTVEDTGDIQKVDMKDDYTKVSVSKLSLVDGSFVVGAILQIVNEKGEVVEEWETEEAIKQFIRLPHGKYQLVEKSAPDGFLIAEPIDFEVIDSPDEIHLVMYDDVVRARISLTKGDSVNPDNTLANAEYTVFDEEGDAVTVLATDEDGYAISNELEIKNYTVKETKAPAAYYVSNDTYTVNMSYEDAMYADADNEVLYDLGTVTDKKIPEGKIQTPLTGDAGTTWLYAILIGLFMVAAGICSFGALSLRKDSKKSI